MTTDVRTIGKTGLAAGQWVQFVTDQDLNEAPVAQKEIYQPNQRFLVISREDTLFDLCRCFLVDMTGKIYDYCPSSRVFVLEHDFTDSVLKGEIRVVSRGSVESIHGVEKVQSVYEAAQKHIEKKADYFARYPAQILGQSKSSASKAQQFRKVNEVLTEKASQSQGDISGILALSMAAKSKNPQEHSVIS